MNKLFISDNDELLKEYLTDFFFESIANSCDAIMLGFNSFLSKKGKVFLKNVVDFEIEGVVVAVSDEQLWKIDQWKDTPLLERVEGTVRCDGQLIKAYYYTSFVTDSKNNHLMNSIISDTELRNYLENFKTSLSLNSLGLSDIYLMIPCTFNEESNKIKIKQEGIAKHFINKLRECIEYEFSDMFIKSLSHEIWGTYEIEIEIGAIPYRHSCIIIFTRHDVANIGILSVFIPTISINGHQVLCNFCSKILRISNGKKFVSLNEWMTEFGVSSCGSHRSAVFSSSKLSPEAISNALAAEDKPMGRIIGEKFQPTPENNLAQYDTAEVYVSEVCLIEINKIMEENLYKRVSSQSIEIFFIQLILLQDAAMSKISSKIRLELDKEIKNPLRKNKKEILDELTCELSEAILFLDFRKLIFPTVRLSAKKVAEKFGLDQIMHTYQQHKEVLERLIDIHHLRVEELENKLLNMLLLILAVAQLLPLFKDIIDSLVKGSFAFSNIFSWTGSIATCFIIWIIYRIIKRKLVIKVIKSKK